MKRFFLSLGLLLSLCSVHAVDVDRIEPTDWFVGMKNPTVQLMVYGKGIATAEVTTDYPGATIAKTVKLDSPNYLLVYVNLEGAQPGTMNLAFKQDGKTKKVKYQLKAREKKGEERIGFSNKDVLYMLMPDRFADGMPEPKAKDVKLNAYKVDRNEPSLRHGGDIEGIRKHLDYFNELGVTALWFTPVLENNSPDNGFKVSTYHGYATTNYYRVDPRFGTRPEGGYGHDFQPLWLRASLGKGYAEQGLVQPPQLAQGVERLFRPTRHKLPADQLQAHTRDGSLRLEGGHEGNG